MTSKTTNIHDNQQPAGFPPAPSEAHQRAAGGKELGRLLLLNLARRCRLARRRLARLQKEEAPKEWIENADGARLEAWNSFQVAKAIYYEWTEEIADRGAADTASEVVPC